MDRMEQWMRDRNDPAPRPTDPRRFRGIGIITTKHSRYRLTTQPQRRSSRFPPGVIWRLLALTQCRCYLCGFHLSVEDAQIEHIIPVARGGTDDETNLAAACKPCNTIKGSRYVAFTTKSRRPIYISSR